LEAKKIKEFKVNKYISLKLEKDNSVIYIVNKPLRVCEYILIDYQIEQVTALDKLKSIDELSLSLDKHLLLKPLIKLLLADKKQVEH